MRIYFLDVIRGKVMNEDSLICSPYCLKLYTEFGCICVRGFPDGKEEHQQSTYSLLAFGFLHIGVIVYTKNNETWVTKARQGISVPRPLALLTTRTKKCNASSKMEIERISQSRLNVGIFTVTNTCEEGMTRENVENGGFSQDENWN